MPRLMEVTVYEDNQLCIYTNLMFSSSVNIENIYFSGVVIGVLITIYSSRNVQAVGTVVYCIGIFGSAFSPSLEVLMFFYGLVAGKIL